MYFRNSDNKIIYSFFNRRLTSSQVLLPIFVPVLNQKNKAMKKLFAVISIFTFLLAFSAPAIASGGEKTKAKKETTAKTESKSDCAAVKAEAKTGCAAACGAKKAVACDREKK